MNNGQTSENIFMFIKFHEIFKINVRQITKLFVEVLFC